MFPTISLSWALTVSERRAQFHSTCESIMHFPINCLLFCSTNRQKRTDETAACRRLRRPGSGYKFRCLRSSHISRISFRKSCAPCWRLAAQGERAWKLIALRLCGRCYTDIGRGHSLAACKEPVSEATRTSELLCLIFSHCT